MYSTKSKSISPPQPAPKLPFHESDLPFHLALCASNTIEQTQGEKLTCQGRLQYTPNFSFNIVLINLIDVKLHSSLFLKTKTESDKENYILYSQVLAEASETLACLLKE